MKCLKLDVKKPSSPNISKCPLTAISGRSAQTKTAPVGAAFGYLLSVMLSFVLQARLTQLSLTQTTKPRQGRGRN